MNRADLVDTTRRVLQCVAGRSLETALEAVSYPAGFFTDKALWQREREQLFFEVPHVVGFGSEVAALGDFDPRRRRRAGPAPRTSLFAEQCQRGLAGWRERVVVGRNEPLPQHLHTVWADGMGDAESHVTGNAPAGRLASVRS